MNQRMNPYVQMRAIQDKQRAEWNNAMENIQAQYQNDVRNLSNQYSPYGVYNPSNASYAPSTQPMPTQQVSMEQVASPASVQPSGIQQNPSAEVNQIPLQQLAMLSEMKNMMAEMRDLLRATKNVTEINTKKDGPAIVETSEKPNKSKTTKTE